MKAFAFRLETLLHLREIAKDKALSQYGKAVAKREFMEGQLLSKERRLAELQDEIASRRKVGFSGSSQQSYQRSLDSAKNDIHRCHSEVQISKKIEESKRLSYLEADSSYKSFVRLKEKKRDEHMEIESKKEESEMDDLIGGRFIYNQSNFDLS